jgi:hypothetical protein
MIKKPISFNLRDNAFGLLIMSIMMLTGLFLISSPPSASPDEDRHQATAWYAIHNLMTPKNTPTMVDQIPSILVQYPCFAFDSRISAKCQVDASPVKLEFIKTEVFNYPPPFYWIVGSGQFFAGLLDFRLMPYGGKLFGAIASLIVLLMAIQTLMRKKQYLSTKALIFLLTPTSLFLIGNSNSSGWEIVTLSLFSATILARIYSDDNQILNPSNKGVRDFSYLCLVSLLAGSARSISFIWMICIFIICGVLFGFKQILSRKLESLAMVSGILLGVLWHLTHPNNMLLKGTILTQDSYSLQNVLHYWWLSISMLPIRVQQMWGVLGWLDTPPHPLAWFITIIFFVIFLKTFFVGNSRILFHKKLLVFVGCLLLFSFLEALKWANWTGWWQGRYSLPLFTSLFICLGFTITNQAPDLLKKPRTEVSSIVREFTPFFLLIIYMVLMNFSRYNYGQMSGVLNFFGVESFGEFQQSLFWLLFCLTLLVFSRSLQLSLKPKEFPSTKRNPEHRYD